MADLIKNLEAATENDLDLFEEVGRWAEQNIKDFSLFRWQTFCAAEAFLEAALTLVPEGAHWTVSDPVGEATLIFGDKVTVYASGGTPAVATCIAVMKATDDV